MTAEVGNDDFRQRGIERRRTAAEGKEIFMSLTRKKLKALGVSDDAIETIIEEHTEVVSGLKADVEKYKGDAEKLPGVQKELDDLKAKGDDGYKKKYEDEHTAFEAFKKQQTDKETRGAKERAYREILKAAGVDEKRIDTILKVTNLDEHEVGTDGKLKDSDKLTESVKTEWADFIVTETHRGAPTPKPPRNTGSGMTKEQIMAIKDRNERREAIARNQDLFAT